MTAFTPNKRVPFAAQSRDEPLPYSCPARITSAVFVAADFRDMTGLHREILEEWRLMDVIALLIPLVNVARARWNVVPLWILIGEIAIEFAKRLGRES